MELFELCVLLVVLVDVDDVCMMCVLFDLLLLSFFLRLRERTRAGVLLSSSVFVVVLSTVCMYVLVCVIA